MGKVYTPETISDILADLSRRVDNLETGGKPIVDLTSRASASFTLASGADTTLAVTLSWTDSTVTTYPKGLPHFSLYIDNDDNGAYFYPDGVSLSSGQLDTFVYWQLDDNDQKSNQYRSRAVYYIRNDDSVSHDYYFYVRWLYVTGGASSS